MIQTIIQARNMVKRYNMECHIVIGTIQAQCGGSVAEG
jgi:hypothetical protein